MTFFLEPDHPQGFAKRKYGEDNLGRRKSSGILKGTRGRVGLAVGEHSKF
jgi:hypothetical protein